MHEMERELTVTRVSLATLPDRLFSDAKGVVRRPTCILRTFVSADRPVGKLCTRFLVKSIAESLLVLRGKRCTRFLVKSIAESLLVLLFY